MALQTGWAALPDEIVVHILTYLEPYHITRLKLVSKSLQKICLDDDLWKRNCFSASPWLQSLQSRRTNLRLLRLANSTRAIDAITSVSHGAEDGRATPPSDPDEDNSQALRPQDIVNWDPVFPGEEVSWYDEYVQRHGPASVNWLQAPQIRDGGYEALIEARGVALYSPHDGEDGIGAMMAVSPLDDGSVCLWDINGTRGRQGGILAKSNKDILFIDGPGSQNTRRSKRIDTGVTECVSVNHRDNKAFFAVQSHLIEVDLERLDIVSRESFEWSITSLSQIDDGVPLTVGTSLGIHLHDFRARAMVPHEVVDRVDVEADADGSSNYWRTIFDPKPLPPYAPLSQPTPISILHLPQSGSASSVSDDIYVSGRFSNILHYDRRKFPAIADSIYSGAWINSLVALPYPFSKASYDLRQMGEASADVVSGYKSGSGRTLVAGGGYKQKGSLELYGLDTPAQSNSTVMMSHFKNRYTASSSSILSVANHGTKIVYSDGSGLIKWFERDGRTECRRLKIGHSDADSQGGLFSSVPASDDLARKIISTRTKRNETRTNNDNILFWTGEKLGMVSFTTSPLFSDFDSESHDEQKMAEDRERQNYVTRTRAALEQERREMRFLTGLVGVKQSQETSSYWEQAISPVFFDTH